MLLDDLLDQEALLDREVRDVPRPAVLPDAGTLAGILDEEDAPARVPRHRLGDQRMSARAGAEVVDLFGKRPRRIQDAARAGDGKVGAPAQALADLLVLEEDLVLERLHDLAELAPLERIVAGSEVEGPFPPVLLEEPAAGVVVGEIPQHEEDVEEVPDDLQARGRAFPPVDEEEVAVGQRQEPQELAQVRDERLIALLDEAPQLAGEFLQRWPPVLNSGPARS